MAGHKATLTAVLSGTAICSMRICEMCFLILRPELRLRSSSFSRCSMRLSTGQQHDARALNLARWLGYLLISDVLVQTAASIRQHSDFQRHGGIEMDFALGEGNDDARLAEILVDNEP